MANITKKVDKNIEPGKRYQYWASSENADDGTVIAAADIFKIEDSLGRPASYVRIETSAGCNLVIRLNSQVVQYKLKAENKNHVIQAPNLDLANPITSTDGTMASIPISEDFTWTLHDVLPVSDIQIVSWSSGTFEVFVS